MIRKVKQEKEEKTQESKENSIVEDEEELIEPAASIPAPIVDFKFKIEDPSLPYGQ
jgi:hypothetical protein